MNAGEDLPRKGVQHEGVTMQYFVHGDIDISALLASNS